MDYILQFIKIHHILKTITRQDLRPVGFAINYLID